MIIAGVCFPREFPATLIVPGARAVEAMGAEDLWIIEDCFYTAGVTLAAAAMVSTERLNIGFGILPAVARNPAITAMELATLAGLGPGRVIGGIGHGVQEWMAQIGERTPSPLTTLREVLDTVRALLRGETVTLDGREVHLSHVRLDTPPNPVPPVLAGVQGPKSLALAGHHADGLVLADWPGPGYCRSALAHAAPSGAFDVAAFAPAYIDADRARARAFMAPAIAASLVGGSVGLKALPFYDDLAARVDASGAEGLVDAPDEWWLELGAIGTPDDALAHVEALAAAGVTRVAFFFPPDQQLWDGQLTWLGEEVLPALRG